MHSRRPLVYRRLANRKRKAEERRAGGLPRAARKPQESLLRGHGPVLSVQAWVELATGDLDRELGGVRAAMARFGLKEGWIVTLSQTDSYKVPEGTVRVVPFHGFDP